jgi:hypothetical protein
MNISFGHQSLFPGKEEISASPPCGFLMGIYLLCKNWSIETFETFRRKKPKKWAIC